MLCPSVPIVVCLALECVVTALLYSDLHHELQLATLDILFTSFLRSAHSMAAVGTERGLKKSLLVLGSSLRFSERVIVGCITSDNPEQKLPKSTTLEF